jgi:hypothetical protein
MPLQIEAVKASIESPLLLLQQHAQLIVLSSASSLKEKFDLEDSRKAAERTVLE